MGKGPPGWGAEEGKGSRGGALRTAGSRGNRVGGVLAQVWAPYPLVPPPVTAFNPPSNPPSLPCCRGETEAQGNASVARLVSGGVRARTQPGPREDRVRLRGRRT